METSIRFLSFLAHFLEWEMFQGKILDKIKTHFMFKLFFLNRAVYEIMWKNIVGPDRPQVLYNKTHVLYILDN
jgi:hypothetical protein